MHLYNKQDIPPPGNYDTVCRISLWGPWITFLLFLTGLLIGVALFVYCYQSSITWGMILAGIYSMIMCFLCLILYRALIAARSPANWLARIGPGGILLKYRSYLHDDSPAEDPIALQLSWQEIVDTQLQQEIYTTTDIDEKRQVRRWFLAIKLDPRYLDIDRIKAALEFEFQRKPAHFKLDELKHKLFIARKNKASTGEIARIKEEIAAEKKRHPGKHRKSYFRDRPVVFIDPDQLRMEWSHITPGKKKLRTVLAHHTRIAEDKLQNFDSEKPMTETEFRALLANFINRDEEIEAVKLVRLQTGRNTTEAKAFIEQIRNQDNQTP